MGALVGTRNTQKTVRGQYLHMALGNPLQSVRAFIRYSLLGQLRSPRDRVGDVIITDTGQSFTVYRETTVQLSNPEQTREGAVLVFQFHLWFMPDMLAPVVTRIFEPLSIITTPFFVGLSGFRTKLWLFDRETGDYEGIYLWESAVAAEQYATALRRAMKVFARPGSISYKIVPDTNLDSYLADRTLGDERRCGD